MRILLTRPRDDAEPLAAKLRARGHAVAIEPLLDIRHEPDATVDLAGVQALLFTSANGVRAFAAASERRDLSVLAVGDATAAAARELGFTAVESAGGDVEDLARLAIRRLDPASGAVFHAAGSALAGDLAGRLGAAGFTVRRAVLYRAEPAQALSPEARNALAGGEVDAVVLFSPRTARTFAGLLAAADLRDSLRGAAAVGLSRAVLDAVADIPFRARIAAAEPKEPAVLAVIDGLEPPRPSPDPVEPASPTPSPRNLAVIGAVVFAGIAALLLLATWIGSRAPGDPAAQLAAQLAATDQKVSALGNTVAAQADVARAVGAVDQRLAGLQARLADLDARLAAAPAAPPDRSGELAELRRRVEAATASRDDPQVAALTAENRRLADELARLQETVSALNARLAERPAAPPPADPAPALAALRQAAVTSGPFAAELLALQAVAGDNAEIRATLAELVPYAERGVPTLDQLRQRFPRVAAEVVRARAQPADAAWWQPALNWAQSLVTVRPIGNVPGDTPAAVVARAERLLAAGDLQGAETALAALTAAAGDAAAGWRRDALARLAAERLLGSLEPVLHGGAAR